MLPDGWEADGGNVGRRDSRNAGQPGGRTARQPDSGNAGKREFRNCRTAISGMGV